MSYEYNEDKMLEGIAAFRAEQKSKIVLPDVEYIPTLLAIHAKTVLRETAHACGTSVAILLSNRDFEYAKMRHIACMILREEPLAYSLPRIGTIMDNHHSTILYSVREGLKRYEADKDFRALVDKVRRAVHEDLGLKLAA